MKHAKVDTNGQFKKLSGVTLISGIQEEDISIWTRVSESILRCPMAKEYYAFLPVESYHMTLNNLYTESGFSGREWRAFINKNLSFFMELDAYCKEHAFLPEISIRCVNVSSSIKLIVNLPSSQTEIIRSLALNFGIWYKMPSEFHITLAYQFKPMCAAIKQEIQQKVTAELSSLIDLELKCLYLKQPALCHFNNMGAFTPWDGAVSPFANNSVLSASGLGHFQDNTTDENASDSNDPPEDGCTIS